MRPRYLNYLVIAALATFIVPQIALAAWWNPMSWNWNVFDWFKKSVISQPIIIKPVQNQHSTTINISSNKTINKQSISKLIINSNLPVFNFRSISIDGNFINNIEITEGNNNKVIQNIRYTDNQGRVIGDNVPSFFTGEDNVKVFDANFDGYKDSLVPLGCGATGNCSFLFYLYNPISNQFIYNSLLSNLVSPGFDTVKHLVVSFNLDMPGDWEQDTYQYQNRQYVLIEKETSTYSRNENTSMVKTYKLQNGKMKLINSVLSNQPAPSPAGLIYPQP